MKLMIRHKGTVYYDRGSCDEVMNRLRVACPNGRIMEAVQPAEEKAMNQVVGELKHVVRDATRHGQFQLAETAQALLRHIQENGCVSMQDADAASFLAEALDLVA